MKADRFPRNGTSQIALYLVQIFIIDISKYLY